MKSLDKTKKKRRAIVKIIEQWALSTTAHGFANIVRTESIILKIIWSFFLLISMGYCIYQVVLSIVQFAQFDVVTSTKIVYEAPTNFPSIAICNLNAYDGDVARDYMNETLFEKNVSKDTYEPIDFVDYASDYFKSTFELKSIKNEFNLFFYGFYLSQMMFSCRYQGINCSENDFINYHDYHYGNCFRFNGNLTNIKTSKQSGWRNGLRLELYIGDPDTQQQYTYKAGMRVIIHNQSVIPFSDEDGVDISVGMQSNIGISRTVLQRKPYPYSNCIDDFKSIDNLKSNEFFEILIKKYPEMTDYNQNYCLKVCLQEFFLQNCACFDFKLPKPDNSSNNNNNRNNKNLTGCETVSELLCLKDKETLFYNGTSIEKCYKNCPSKCYQVFYDTKITTAKYPSKWYASILKNSTSLPNPSGHFDRVISSDYFELQQTILMANVYYDSMFYVIIEELPEMSIEILIAYIGGNLGLFIGISLLSLVEIIEILFYILYMFIKKSCFLNLRYAKSRKIDIKSQDNNEKTEI